ncbi:phospholipase D-like domain-containing protein [Exiguobacterium sp. SH3S1]|uniref:phospholipase D-like domain-containing protein n=1 Tax=Exiguobacterium sp. SH3S1 TaxID=2510955 RepID=UPI00103A9E45|nr:phospholipase D-like domain-containing protein [Exiguobacterium sp. SH3S1]TCI60812.1 hypothetical protein EVJ26_11100 [Exiguobacterium sp. SH3S1]
MLWKLSEQLSNDQQKLKIIEEAMGDKNYLHILETIEWEMPIDSYEVKVTSATKSKLDILKKMIMTLAQNDSGVSLTDASEFLRVDALFVEDLINQMERTGILEKISKVYRLTKIGQTQLAAGTVLGEPQVEKIEFQFNALQKKVLNDIDTNPFIHSEKDEGHQYYRYSEGETSLTNRVLEESEFRQYLIGSRQPFEIGGKEKIISKISPLQFMNRKYGKVLEFRLYDLAEDHVFTRVWNGANSKFDESLENQINELENETWREQYHEEILDQMPKRYERLRELMLQTDSEKQNGKQEGKFIELLRGIDIRNRFIDSFEQTQKKMLMVSPWISSSVMDREMFDRLEKFAASGKTLYISWGIAKQIKYEDRAPNAELIQRIRSIKHKDGTPAIFIRWFGNQHNKEIVLDKKTLLLGSFNWLSYRGDYNLRHESVVITTEEGLIDETIHMIEEKFIVELERELQQIFNHSARSLDSIKLKNWMKELIMLDTQLDKRKELSTKLMLHLHNENREDLAFELSKLWLVYDKEEVGALDYLKELLVRHETERATQYFMLALKHVQTSSIWPSAEIFSAHADWFAQFEKFIEAKEELLREKNKVLVSKKKVKNQRKKR